MPSGRGLPYTDRAAKQTAITHNVGTADGTIDDVGAAFSQAVLNNNFKELSTKVNAIITALQDAGLMTR